MIKYFCENCGKKVPKSKFKKITTEKKYVIKDEKLIEIKTIPIEPYYKIDPNYKCKCGKYPNSSFSDFKINFCSGCGKSIIDIDYNQNHLIDLVDEISGEVYNYCNLTDQKVNFY